MEILSLRQRAFHSFLISSLLIGLSILFPMPSLYVQDYYDILYIVFLGLGILIGDIGSILFRYRFGSVQALTLASQLILFLSMLLFPFAHRYYAYAHQIRILLLFLVFLLGFLFFFLFVKLGEVKVKYAFYFPLLFSCIILIFSLLLQVYLTVPSWEIFIFLVLSGLSWSLIKKVYWMSLLMTVVLALEITSMIIFQKWQLYYINTEQESPEMRMFNMVEQVDIYKAEPSTKKDLDIADTYTEGMDTHKNIYLNGRYYGKLVESTNRQEYSTQTPLSILFSLQDNPRVLILNSDGGGDVSLTHLLISGGIDALESSQDILHQIRDRESLYVGGIYHNRNTLFYHSTMRSYVATTSKKYDTILLDYSIPYSQEIPFLQEKDPQFSEEAVQDYLKVLNPQGVFFLKISTFSEDLTRGFLISFLSTLATVVQHTPSEWEHLIYLFQTPYSVNLIFSRVPLTQDKVQAYQNHIKTLGYRDVLSDSTNNWKDDVKAIFNKDKNHQFSYSYFASPVKDNRTEWFFGALRNLSLFSSNPLDFEAPIVEKSLWIVFALCLILFLLFHRQFKKQQLYRMGLGLFFLLLMMTGLVLGMSLVMGISLFGILQPNNHSISGNLFLMSLLAAQIISGIWIYHPLRFHTKIQIGLSLQFLLYGLLLWQLSNIISDIFVLSLAWRIILPCVVLFAFYLFSFSTPIFQLALASLMHEREAERLFLIFLLGVVMGLCLGFLLFLYYPLYFLLGICLVILFCTIFYGYSLDMKLSMFDYRYSKKII